MSTTKTRLSLFYYDLVRELCTSCRREKFHFVAKGVDPAATDCSCGASREIAELSDTSISRLVDRDSGEIAISPRA